MQDFMYNSPTTIFFGKESEQKIGPQSRRLGKKILLHYGVGSIKVSGLYDVTVLALKKEGIEFVELGGVKPNPRLSLVQEGIKLCREEGVEGILAVGGGSVIDSAKAIAAGVPFDGDIWDFFQGKCGLETALPVGVVLTFPAAGSEASWATVITKEETNEKLGPGDELLRPVFAILNPVRTFTLPAYQTACGVVDIMAHVMERYFTNEPNVAFSDRMCEALLKTMIEQAPKVLRNPQEYAARAEIMWAGTLAHNDVLGRGRTEDWSSHGIEHELSAFYDITHGAGLAVIFPAWMKHVYKTNIQRFVQFAVRVWDVDYTAGEEELVVLEGIRRMEEFFQSLGLATTISGLGITEKNYEQMARKAIGSAPGVFCPLTVQDIVRIYELAQ